MLMMTSAEPPLSEIRSAARMGNVEALRKLTVDWKGHPVLNERKGDIMGLSPLHWAVAAGSARGREECLQVLIDMGADVDVVNNSGSSALMYACATGKIECVEILLEAKANIEKKGLYGQTPLHAAAMRGDENIVRLLLEHGSQVNETDDNGDTALHLARRFGKTETENMLLSMGADRGMKNSRGQSAFDYEATSITNLSYE